MTTTTASAKRYSVITRRGALLFESDSLTEARAERDQWNEPRARAGRAACGGLRAVRHRSAHGRPGGSVGVTHEQPIASARDIRLAAKLLASQKPHMRPADHAILMAVLNQQIDAWLTGQRVP